nr:unnamed protein product [Digitaria exilis]
MEIREGGPCGGSPNDLKASRLGGGRTCVDISEVAWRLRGKGRFGWFGPQNHQACEFPSFVKAACPLHPHLFIHRCPISIHPPPPPMAPSEGRRPGYAPVFQGIILI